jgi:hypothetical protein
VRIGIVFTGGECLQQSVTYQAILEEGELKGMRGVLLRQGKQRFGQPASRSVRSRIGWIRSLDALDQLIDRLFQVGSWDELLADVPALKPPSRRRKRR